MCSAKVDMTELSANEWLNKYSNNNSVKGLLDEKLKDLNSLIEKKKELRGYNKGLKNLKKAKMILELRGHTPGVKAIDIYLEKYEKINEHFEKII